MLEVCAEFGGGFDGAIPDRACVGLESRVTELVVDDLDDDVVGIVVIAAKQETAQVLEHTVMTLRGLPRRFPLAVRIGLGEMPRITMVS